MYLLQTKYYNLPLSLHIFKLKSSKAHGGGSSKIYENALDKLRSDIDTLARENAALQLNLDNCEQDLIDARERYDERDHI